METKIKTKAYIVKLKKRLAVLKKRREKDIARYKHDVSVWKTDMERWVRAHVNQRLVNININELRRYQPRYEHERGHRMRFGTIEFFKGAPEPPMYPNDAVIREIQKLIALLSMSDAPLTTINGTDVERLFSDDKPEPIPGQDE